MKRKHKHTKTFRILRFLKVCGDTIPDKNRTTYGIYVNWINPLSWIVMTIAIIFSILLNGIGSIPEIYKEIKNLKRKQ